MNTHTRPWMLLYTVGFALFSAAGVYDDFAQHYPLLVSAWACIIYIVIFLGNLLYSLNRVPSSFRTPWKIVFPVLVFQFLLSGYYDWQHGSGVKGTSLSLLIIGFLIDLLLFVPTFWAHYRIGYGRRGQEVVA